MFSGTFKKRLGPPAPRRCRFFWTDGAPPTKIDRRAAADTMTSAHGSSQRVVHGKLRSDFQRGQSQRRQSWGGWPPQILEWGDCVVVVKYYYILIISYNVQEYGMKTHSKVVTFKK